MISGEAANTNFIVYWFDPTTTYEVGLLTIMPPILSQAIEIGPSVSTVEGVQ